jgi:hypothetical protein
MHTIGLRTKKTGRQMTTTEGLRGISAKEAFKATAGRATDNPWVETSWTVLEAASDLGDEITIDACLRVIDDHFYRDLPRQSDLNIVFCFMNAHLH